MVLFRYFIREYLKYVFGTVIVSSFLFILFDFVHKSTRTFASNQPTTFQILEFYFYSLPFQIVQSLPIASLLASVIVMVIHSRSNEVTMMRAAGMGPLRIGAPLVASGLILSIGSFFLSEFVTPPASERMYYILNVLIEKKSDTELGRGARWMREGNRLVNFGEYDPLKRSLKEVKLIDFNDQFQLESVTTVKEAIYVNGEMEWQGNRMRTVRLSLDGSVLDIEKNNSLALNLPIDPSKLKKERRRPDELSLRELNELIDRGERQGSDVLPEKIAFHVKLAYPFAALVVSLMGLSFGYRSERSSETVRSILLAFGIGISYWFILSATKALGTRGDLSPALAAWLANLFILTITFFSVLRVNRT
jgi:lipopolysaccharide export system permease protein